jgi:hypothetical protein
MEARGEYSNFATYFNLKIVNEVTSTHVETCVLLYHKDYTVGEKGKKVTVEVGMNK